jgi:small-conductance mechanosensitive channel
MENYDQFLRIVVAGNTVGQYLYTTLLFILLLILFRVFTRYVLAKLEIVAKKTKTDLDDMLMEVIEGIRWPMYVGLALYFSSKMIQLSPGIEKTILYIFIILLTIEGVRALQNIIKYGAEKYAGTKDNKQVVDLISTLLKVGLWAMAALLILSNLGYNISSLIAGLGIGGIAIALAVQNILGDVFNSFSIYLDKPFQVGDYIIVGTDVQGTVKKIGLKSTRVTSIQGEELVISNQDLTSARIQNFKKMKNRRIVNAIGVTYETKKTHLKDIPKIVKAIFAKTKMADFDRMHFKEFGDFSLNFELVYFVKTNDYKKYMDIQHKINLAIKEAFDKKGIEFAYPTQTLFLENFKS